MASYSEGAFCEIYYSVAPGFNIFICACFCCLVFFYFWAFLGIKRHYLGCSNTFAQAKQQKRPIKQANK